MNQNRTESALESFYKVNWNFKKRLGNKSNAVQHEGAVNISVKWQVQRGQCGAMEVASSKRKKQLVVRVLVLRGFVAKRLDDNCRRPSSWWPQ